MHLLRQISSLRRLGRQWRLGQQLLGQQLLGQELQLVQVVLAQEQLQEQVLILIVNYQDDHPNHFQLMGY